jgi:hypothetical protein
MIPRRIEGGGEMRIDYSETKYCPRCRRYVRYLMALHESYCVHCDTKVRLFSDEDMNKFKRTPVLGARNPVRRRFLPTRNGGAVARRGAS